MTPRRSPQFWLAAGFSRLETVMTLLLGLIMIAALGHLLMAQPRLAESLDAAREYMQNARLSLEVISREARLSGYNPTGARFDGLLVTLDVLQIKADLNGDGDTDDADEEIRYTYDSTRQAILRMARHGQEVLAEHVRQFTVTALDAAAQPTTESAEIRQLYVQVHTGASTPGVPLSGSEPEPTYILSTVVKIRNVSAVTEPGRG
ncbi:MAG: PilW family protein [Candidatus Tectimicrobiota bacterium]